VRIAVKYGCFFLKGINKCRVLPIPIVVFMIGAIMLFMDIVPPMVKSPPSAHKATAEVCDQKE
jgi:hypothetical protein